jgi:hypothetical protein
VGGATGIISGTPRLIIGSEQELAEQISPEQLSCLHEELKKVRTSVDAFLKVSP